MDPPADAATAYHEAGHAVVALALGRPVTRVSVRADRERLGWCAFGKGVFRPSADWLQAEGLMSPRRYALAVKVVANAPLRVPADALIELVVRTGFGAADDWIAAHAGAGDVVITADVPLAARGLAAGARVLDPRGRPFTDADIGA